MRVQAESAVECLGGGYRGFFRIKTWIEETEVGCEECLPGRTIGWRRSAKTVVTLWNGGMEEAECSQAASGC